MRDEEEFSRKLVVQSDAGQQMKRLNRTYVQIDAKLSLLQNEYLKHIRSRSSLLRGCSLLLSQLPHHSQADFMCINKNDPYPLLDLTPLDFTSTSGTLLNDSSNLGDFTYPDEFVSDSNSPLTSSFDFPIDLLSSSLNLANSESNSSENEGRFQLFQ